MIGVIKGDTRGSDYSSCREWLAVVNLLGGSWALVTSWNWAYKPTYQTQWPYRCYPKYK